MEEWWLNINMTDADSSKWYHTEKEISIGYITVDLEWHRFANLAYGISANLRFLFLIHVHNSFNFVSNLLKAETCSITMAAFYLNWKKYKGMHSIAFAFQKDSSWNTSEEVLWREVFVSCLLTNNMETILKSIWLNSYRSNFGILKSNFLNFV